MITMEDEAYRKSYKCTQINDIFLFPEVKLLYQIICLSRKQETPGGILGRERKSGYLKIGQVNCKRSLPLRGQADGLGQVHGGKGKSGKQDCRLHCDKAGHIVDSNQIRTKSIK